MTNYIKKQYFISTALTCNKDPEAMLEQFHKDGHTIKIQAVKLRLKKYITKGKIPLDSGNSVSLGEQLKGTSTLYAEDGSIKMQWVKSDVDAETRINAIEATISELASSIQPVIELPSPTLTDPDLATLYISNDLHLGMLATRTETGTDWNLDSAITTLKSAYDHLFATSPASRVGIVVDLGDLTEADGHRKGTTKSGNAVDLSTTYPVVLRAAYESFIYAINLALLKHELVYFYNIGGNHSTENATCIREVVKQVYKDNPRVIVEDSASTIKYHQHGQVLFQFFHGDSMKMKQAGETMAADCQDIFSSTRHRFSHAGHTHVDSVYDGTLCRVESHRNLPPVNAWAADHGYRRGVGTMKSISYDASLGEVSRSIYNVTT